MLAGRRSSRPALRPNVRHRNRLNESFFFAFFQANFSCVCACVLFFFHFHSFHLQFHFVVSFIFIYRHVRFCACKCGGRAGTRSVGAYRLMCGLCIDTFSCELGASLFIFFIFNKRNRVRVCALDRARQPVIWEVAADDVVVWKRLSAAGGRIGHLLFLRVHTHYIAILSNATRFFFLLLISRIWLPIK